jgi:hypothetical protein
MRKLFKETIKTYLPEALKQFAVPKESEDSDPVLTLLSLKLILKALAKTFPIDIIDIKDIHIFVRFV